MKSKPKKHRNDAAFARIHARFGWRTNDVEARDRAAEQLPWRRVDSGNLARIASALERIAGYLGRVTKKIEERF